MRVKIKAYFKEKQNSVYERIKIYLYFSVMFCLIAAVIYIPVFKSGRTLVWKNDGFMQYIRALEYYGSYLRSAVRTIITEHRLSLPHFSLCFGEGADFTESLGYYCVGDPLALIFAVIPERLYYIAYSFMSLLRLYLAGIACLWFIRDTNPHRPYYLPDVCGALLYSFSYWGLLNAARHPYFLNPLIYLPLILLGVVRLTDKRRPVLLVISSALASASSLYFFFMITLVTAGFTVIRLAVYRVHGIEFIKKIISVGLFAFLGVGISAVSVLPTVFFYLSNARGGYSFKKHLFYPVKYYTALVVNFVFGGDTDLYWQSLGYTFIGLAALIYLVYATLKSGRAASGRRKLLTFFWILSIVMLVFPVFGQLFNADTYMCNRWSFALSLLMGCTVSEVYHDMESVLKKWFRYVLRAAFPLLLVFNAYLLYSPYGQDYASELKTVYEINNTLRANESLAVKMAYEADRSEENKENNKENNKEELFRYAAKSPVYNAALTARLSGIQFYYSISNPYLAEYRNELGFIEGNIFNHQGYDMRTSAMSLSGVKYFSVHTPDDKDIPYGFVYRGTEFVQDSLPAEWRYDIYRNKNFVPLFYMTDLYAFRKDFDVLSLQKRDDFLCQAAVLEECPQTLNADAKAGFVDRLSREVVYEAEPVSDGIVIEDNRITVTDEKAEAVFHLKNAMPEAEYRFEFDNLKWIPYDEAQTYQSMKTRCSFVYKNPDGADVTFMIKGDDDAHYEGRSNYLVNIGYKKNALNEIRVVFPKGSFTFDSMKLYCQDMKAVEKALSRFINGGNHVAEVKNNGDEFNCNTDYERDGLLIAQLPYSEGFKAYVDEKETSVIRTNVKYMSVPVPKGKHSIKIVYETPYMRMGFVISVIAIMILIMLAAVQKRFNR